MEFGIDAIDYYLPKLAMNISDLAEARNIPSAKLILEPVPVGVTEELDVTTFAWREVFDVKTSALANDATVPVVPELVYLMYRVFVLGLFASAPSKASITYAFTPVVDPVSSEPINAAAFTHTSVAIRDALELFKKPIIELHISNIYKREEFRQKSLISDIVTGGIFGLGADGYILAIISMQKLLKNENW